MMMYCFVFMILGGVIMFVSNRKHLLVVLMSIEYIMLGLFLGLSCVFLMNFGEMFFLLVFLVFAACEGSLGLSILVGVIRSHGNDYFNSLSVLQC
uniref:NADH-ubiquinone oxidoreductase chain 4L n=1 Tax=Scutigera coleoptrata TaxID=29022 RepID=Q70XS1_SCUCO|nr:NADH dehydrogenase subunit 4L [Scutigera coleoptrata]CAE01478.1 NADH dehydrogenase subunit 4L [Scutigera coleoptrata]